jgi:hypothetical protein
VPLTQDTRPAPRTFRSHAQEHPLVKGCHTPLERPLVNPPLIGMIFQICMKNRVIGLAHNSRFAIAVALRGWMKT